MRGRVPISQLDGRQAVRMGSDPLPNIIIEDESQKKPAPVI